VAQAEEIPSKIPFTVVGSDEMVMTPERRQVRGRAYKLHQMLIRTYMEELPLTLSDIMCSFTPSPGHEGEGDE